MKKIFFLLASLVVCASHSQAAVTAPDSAFATFYSRVTGPGVQTVGFGSNGTPVVAPGVPSVSSAGGPVQVARTGSLPLPAGARLPVTATAKIPNSAVASIIKKALPYARTATNPLALTLLALELGFSLSTSDSGDPVLSKPDPAVCSVAPCYSYNLVSSAGTASGVTPAVACTMYTNQIKAKYGWTYLVVSSSASQCVTSFNGNVSYVNWTSVTSVAPTASTGLPASHQDFLDAIAAKSGWPSGSAVAQALVDAQKVTGDQIPTEQPSVTGPATVQGPTEVATTPYGDQVKKSTKASNYSCTYVQGATVMDGGSAICTQKTTTTDEVTTTNPTTGVVTTTTTTTGEQTTKPADIKPDEKPAKDTCGMPGTPACKIDEAGTPGQVAEAVYSPKVDILKSQKEVGLSTISGVADKSSLFGNYSLFFSAPAFVVCEPIQLPAYKGVSMGALDACPVVDGMRQVMGYLWALGGLFLCLGFIRQTV
jgi:hypothetical protein